MGVEPTTFELEVQRASPLRHRGWHISLSYCLNNRGKRRFSLCPRGGTLGIFGWGCAAGTLEPLAYTRARSSEFCYPILD